MCDGDPCLWISSVAPFVGDVPSNLTSLRGVRVAETQLGTSLVQSLGPGCAMVWNNPLHERLRSTLPVTGVLMHDAWVGLVATAIGRVIKSEEVGVLYRLHERNTIGLEKPLLRRAAALLHRLNRGEPTFASQAAELLRQFGSQLPASSREMVVSVATWNRRGLFRLWLKGRIRRTGFRENSLLALRFLLPK